VIELDIVTAERRVHYKSNNLDFALPTQVKWVLVPTSEGYRQIFSNHTPLLALLSTGVLEFETLDGSHCKLVISQGYLDFSDNKASILCENASLPSEINLDLEKQTLQEIESKLRALGTVSSDDIQFKMLRTQAKEASAKLTIN
jgi:F0F1-type ATP synthase epsilon subunit